MATATDGSETKTGEAVAIIETGVANIASMLAAFRRLGASPRLDSAPETVETADYVVLPGVGSFGAGMETLREAGLIEPLVERIEAGRPTLAVCLGLQLLFEGSEESPGVDGFGIAPGEVRRFPEGVRTPQFGWNEVVARDECRFLSHGYAYFANSYRVVEAPEGWAPATSEYGGSFVAAMERGDVLACQFHPEISGRWGLDMLSRWLRGGD